MDTVQLSIHDASYAAALRELLERNGNYVVCSGAVPDPRRTGVMVVDSDALELLPLPLPNPERVVLITRNDAEHLSQAWNSGIRSVVFCDDPLSTAMLAIMAAGLRVSKPEPKCAAPHAVHSGPLPAKAGEAVLEKPRERRG